MSGKRSKKLREEFESKFGYPVTMHDSSHYKKDWRKFKKEYKKNHGK